MSESAALVGRTALITGGTRGLGREIARAYLRAGARGVCVCGRDARALEEAVVELRELAGPGRVVEGVLADVSVPADTRRLIETAIEALGEITILVSNAGVQGPAGPVGQVGWVEWARTIEINLFGSVLPARALAAHFIERGYGKIIQLSGGGATKPMPGLSAYAASKAAVVRFTETIAGELSEHHVDVNAIAPGALNTRMLDEVLAAGPDRVGDAHYQRALEQQRSGGVPLRRGAELAVFLGSAASDGITGKLLSAVWDPWSELPAHGADLESDVYTLRRVVPADRGLDWGLPDQPAASPRGPRPVIRQPTGSRSLPSFDEGWHRADGTTDPFLSYVDEEHRVNWSLELEEMHVESTRDHFIDVWTRAAILERLGPLGEDAVVVDLGCSSGYLLEQLRATGADLRLIGVDLVESGLREAHARVPSARLLRADVCELPLLDASVDAIASANLLEHVPDDMAALSELRRVLRPGGRAVLVVPAGPGLYDYYDRFLGHERRYARGELAAKTRSVGLEVLEDAHIGSLVHPAFWSVKKLNRLRHGRLEGQALEARVASNIAGTRDSRLGRVACEVERRLLSRNVRLPFGARGMIVARRALVER